MSKPQLFAAFAACFSLSLPEAAIARKLYDSWPVVAQERDEQAGCDIGVIGNGKFYFVVATGLPANSDALLQATNGEVPGIVLPDEQQSKFSRWPEYSRQSKFRRWSDYSKQYPFSNGKVRTLYKTVRTDANGEYRAYVLPFVHDRPGGVQTVAITAGDCRVQTSFNWQRGIRVID